MKPTSEEPPIPPRKPDPDECCGSGCALCVLDRYERELEAYARALEAWKRAHGDAPTE